MTTPCRFKPVDVVSESRFDFSFQLPLRQRVVEFLPTREIGFVCTFLVLGLDSAPAARSRNDGQEATEFRAIDVRALQGTMPGSPNPAGVKIVCRMV